MTPVSKKLIAHRLGAFIGPVAAMAMVGFARKNGFELNQEEVETMFTAMATVTAIYLLGQSHVDAKKVVTQTEAARPVEDPANKRP